LFNARAATETITADGTLNLTIKGPTCLDTPRPSKPAIPDPMATILRRNWTSRST